MTTTTTTTTTTTHTPPTILTRQPFKTIYILGAILLEAFVRLPLSALLYLLLPSLTRPDPDWTWRQAIGVRLLRAIVHHSAEVEVRVPLSLAPGAEGDRFEVMEPVESSAYRGPLQADDDDTPRPARIGGTWYPEPYPASATTDGDDDNDNNNNNNEKAIVLHFHGGAFVLGDGRERDCGHLARTMLSTCGASISHVFCPQYRLASAAPFPAALQDALTAYLHLRRRLRVPAGRIVLSGDSAGGNIVNGLLRYLGTYYHDGGGAEQRSPPPAACAWLWSPWTSPALALVPGRVARSPNYRSDYVSERFGAWGCRAYAGRRREGLVDDGWITAVAADPFPSPSPVWVQTGARELLLHDNVEFFEGLRRLNEEKKRAGGGVVGQPCELEIVPHAPHDIALLGHVLGFSREYAEALKKAEAFFQRVRK